MDNFDLTKYLAEGKLHEAATTMDMQDVLKGEKPNISISKNKAEDFKPGMKVIPLMRLGGNDAKNHIGTVTSVEDDKVIYRKNDQTTDLSPSDLVIITGK